MRWEWLGGECTIIDRPLLLTDRSVCGGGDRGGRPAAAVYPEAELREGMGT